MKAFWAIVKLTFRNALRSHIFQLLAFLLLLCVVLVPTTISGDGTAAGFIRISLLYSLSGVNAILALSSIWLGCFVMTQDVDNYQLHMVVTKPVSRCRIWLAKWTGVCLIHLVLLFVATTVIYFIILAMFNRQDFPEAERTRIRNEVMVGRRVYLPEMPDLGEATRNLLKDKIQRLQKQGASVDMSPSAQEKMMDDVRREVVSLQSQVHYNVPRQWVFKNLPKNPGKSLFLRYRPYVDKVATEGQRMTRSWWAVGIPQLRAKGATGSVFDGLKQEYEIYYAPLSEYPEQVMSGTFHEKELRTEWNMITPDNEIYFTYLNYDDSHSMQYFQPADGPKLLIEVCSFFENYLRTVLVIALELVILAGLGCTFGGFLSMPTAIFVVVSYLLFGSFAVYMSNLTFFSGTADYVGHYIGRTLLWVVIPVQAFDVSSLAATGELVEFRYIWQLTYNYLLLRAVPLFALGMVLYWRRELGLVIRK